MARNPIHVAKRYLETGVHRDTVASPPPRLRSETIPTGWVSARQVTGINYNEGATQEVAIALGLDLNSSSEGNDGFYDTEAGRPITGLGIWCDKNNHPYVALAQSREKHIDPGETADQEVWLRTGATRLLFDVNADAEFLTELLDCGTVVLMESNHLDQYVAGEIAAGLLITCAIDRKTLATNIVRAAEDTFTRPNKT